MNQCIQPTVGFQVDGAAFTAITTARTTAGYIFLSSECYHSIAAGSGYNHNFSFIYKHNIPSGDIEALIRYQENEEAFPCALVEEDGIYQNYVDDSVRQLYDMLDFPHPPLRPLRGNGGKEVYQLIAFFSPGHEERIMSVLPHCEATRWNPLFADVVPRGSSKAVGIDKIIEYYGISLHETMAFGDGGNDMAMLCHAGIGVAMGNAGDEVKEAADYVTDSVDDDGVMNALRHFDVI